MRNHKSKDALLPLFCSTAKHSHIGGNARRLHFFLRRSVAGPCGEAGDFDFDFVNVVSLFDRYGLWISRRCTKISCLCYQILIGALRKGRKEEGEKGEGSDCGGYLCTSSGPSAAMVLRLVKTLVLLAVVMPVVVCLRWWCW